jgi:DNA-directed RNA polymerase specialized sigma24 family protein
MASGGSVGPAWSSPRVLNERSLEKLLAALDGDRETAGEKYEGLRRGVVRFFEWRGCSSPEECADEAIDRAARKLEAGVEIVDIYPYVLGVARFVLMEFRKKQERQQSALRELRQRPLPAEASDRPPLRCIDRCLDALAADERELILSYYRDDKRQKIDTRKALASRLGIAAYTLRMRAHRLRARLEVCVGDCMRS